MLDKPMPEILPFAPYIAVVSTAFGLALCDLWRTRLKHHEVDNVGDPILFKPHVAADPHHFTNRLHYHNSPAVL